ncbi:usherin-like [Amphiura filiformis]|uniref:usherin-like n=1 Tax=Amphiura filiformis TaxID=82378 RepID=UPI003B22384D
MPDPRVHIGNPNITSYTVEGLVAYTQYSVTIEACTPGGCTESSPTLAQTDPYFPEGQAPPRGDPITQSYISVIWSPPSKPNGPGIRYDLHRMKVRQSLETGVIIGLGFWELIYQGTKIDYQDVGLTTFTTYQYRVTVYNNIGPTTSDPSEEVTTLAGIPRQSGSITAVVLDHISVQLNWTTPTLQELQGEVVAYYIDYRWDSGYVSLEYPPGVDADILDDLDPNTGYEFVQTIFNGAYNISSPTEYAETLDGAPSGFDPPIIYVISPSAVRVAWKAPSQPNGEITKYSVYRDDVQITMLPPTVQSHVFSDLQPYTVYAMQVEVCTVYNCILSNITYTTTLEAPPAGISPPNLRVLGSQDMDINWAAPSQPNGIIQQYEVLRRAVVSCDNELGDPSDPDAEVCTYRECSITESICGTQCYSGNQVCCGGILHDYQSGYECCDTNYLPGRNSPSDVCCGGRFTPSLPNHECCQGQYVQVLAGQICCPDPGENRVAVGFGDVCCGGVPFENSGPQICCAGEFYGKNQGLCCRGDFVAFDAFHDGFNSKCCGGSVIESNQVCCEENGEGVGYEPDSDMECCGTDYIDPDVTLCCVNDAGSAKVHYYTNSAAKSSANEHCCGLQNIGPSQSCCNNIGYNPATHVCADRSTTAQGGCGGGTLCPISQAPSAYCDRCDFDPNTHTCGAIEGYHVTAPPTPAGNPGNRDGQCHSGLLSIYVGGPNAYSYQDANLSPYTTYEYTIAVHNSAGSASSELSIAITHEDIPDGVQAPKWTVDQGVLDTIQLTWDQPEYPNGEISTYILRRDDIEIYRGDAMEYNDNNGIQPYQHYTYVLGACTTVGCASSEQVVAATLQAPPDNLFDPAVNPVDAHSLRVTWQIPGLPNGVIQFYNVLLNGEEEPLHIADPQTFSYVHRNLDPYTSYEYAIQACTAAGCTTSNTVRARTLQAAPQGVSSPVHVTVSATILEIYWQAPTIPNGVITTYRLYRYNRIVYTGGANTLLYTDRGLQPNSRYEYILEASTMAGGSNSTLYVCQTPQDAPEGIPAPNLSVQSATQITATWTPPTNPNGNIVHYAVMLQSGSTDQFTRSAGLTNSIVIDRLTPSTYYDVRVQACNAGGCGVGPKSYAQTFEAPPEGQDKPSLEATGRPLLMCHGNHLLDLMVSSQSTISTEGYKVQIRSCLCTLLMAIILFQKRWWWTATIFSFTEYRVRAENSEVIQMVRGRNCESVCYRATWSPPSLPNGVISGYRIEYQKVSNDPTLSHPIIQAATVDGTDATFYGLLPHTPYNVRIIAINGAGETPGTWAQVTTQQGVPADVRGFFVEKIPDGQSLLLRWEAPGQPNGEIIEYRIYEDIYLITPLYVGLNREYLFRRLDPFTEYVVVLEACTSIGCGRGDPQTVVTSEIPPDNQAPPSFGFVNATVVQLIWKPPVNPNGQIIRYDIIRRTSSLSSRRRRDTDNSRFTETRTIYSEYNTNRDEFDYADETLHPYQLYEYRIRAINSKGNIESDWVNVQTAQAPPIGVFAPYYLMSQAIHHLCSYNGRNRLKSTASHRAIKYSVITVRLIVFQLIAITVHRYRIESFYGLFVHLNCMFWRGLYKK